MTQEAASDREDLEQLRRRFEEFRRTHAVRSRLPEELLSAAAKLARRDGIEATAQALAVERPSLRKWTDRFEPRAQVKPRQSPRRQPQGDSGTPSFVELLAASTRTRNSCLVVVESPRAASCGWGSPRRHHLSD
jgi:hypothetical protein